MENHKTKKLRLLIYSLSVSYFLIFVFIYFFGGYPASRSAWGEDLAYLVNPSLFKIVFVLLKNIFVGGFVFCRVGCP